MRDRIKLGVVAAVIFVAGVVALLFILGGRNPNPAQSGPTLRISPPPAISVKCGSDESESMCRSRLERVIQEANLFLPRGVGD